MSRKIKIQTVNTENLEKTLKENILNKPSINSIPNPCEETLIKIKKVNNNELKENNSNIENIGDASAYTDNDNSIVVNINDIKIKNIIERFNDIILDVTTDDFTDNMSINDKIKKNIRQNKDCKVFSEDFQLFLDIINIEEYDDIKNIPIYIKAIINDLHGTISSFLYRQIAGYYNFLIKKLNINIESITKDSYYVRLVNHYINKWQSEFNVPEEDLNKMSETAGTNYNIINEKISEAFRDSKSTILKDVEKVLNSLEEPNINPSGKSSMEKNCSEGTDTNYEHVNHPNHYNNYDKEVIDMMIDIWGKEQTAIFCKLNAFKYRMRMGTKPENNILQDLKKEKWYLVKYNELIN